MTIRALFILLLVVPLTSCYRIAYRVGDAADRTYTNRDWNAFFVFGLAPVEESRNLETLCPGSKILEIKSFVAPANLMAGIMGFGMTSATSLEYTCTFPEDRIAKSAGRIRDSILGRLGLGGETRREDEVR